MSLTLADGRTRLAILTAAPADPDAITTAEFAAGIEAADFINKPDFKMSPTNPDTVPDQPISQKGNATTWGNSNFEAAMTVLRDLVAATGLPEAAGDEVWEAVETAGTTIWLVKRTGPLEETPWAAGQPRTWTSPSTSRAGSAW